MRLAQLREMAATERMERAAFINCLKGEDLLEMMFGVHSDKEEVLLKLPQARGKGGGEGGTAIQLVVQSNAKKVLCCTAQCTLHSAEALVVQQDVLKVAHSSILGKTL